MKFEQGRIWLPTEAPWLALCEAELFQFPYCKLDDQIDSTVQLLSAADYQAFQSRLRFLT